MRSRGKVRRGVVLLIALAPLLSPAAARGQDPAFDEAAIATALDVVRSDPQINPEKTIKTLRWREQAQPVRQRPAGWLAWVAGFFAWLGQSARYVVWVAAAMLAVLAARYVLAMAVQARPSAGGDEPFVAPTHVRDLDIRPASLPPDIGAAARALWDGQQHRAALALLYRGLLSRLAHVHSVPVRDSTTEGDCLALAAAHLPAPPRDYASRLVRIWQVAVYGHQDVSSAAVHDLCDRFALALDAGGVAARDGKGPA